MSQCKKKPVNYEEVDSDDDDNDDDDDDTPFIEIMNRSKA